MKDPAYPYAGNPRQFLAVAMPNGDARFGIEGPLVFLSEKRGSCTDRPRFLSRGEAEQLRDALDAALQTFDVGRVLSAIVGDADDCPKPARAPYPFRDHRTLAEQEPDHAL
jgi:hypothetical protein